MKYILFFILTLNSFEVFAQKPTVLVLPPYDEIANAGISPTTQEMLAKKLVTSQRIELIKLASTNSFYSVFDKKYCKEILDKMQVDVIVMTKLDYKKRTGYMNTDLWDMQLRIYYVKLDTQLYSKIRVKNLTSNEIEKFIDRNIDILISEIVN